MKSVLPQNYFLEVKHIFALTDPEIYGMDF